MIANPNCTAAVLLMALAPLHREARAKRVVVATYQAVSGKGARAMEECRKQTKDVLEGRPAVPHVFPRPIAFNLIPQVDDFAPDGRTKEEIKVENETRKILEDPSIRVDATCVRVPVLRCHSEAVNVEFERPITPERARELWRSAPGVVSMDDPAAGVYPTPLDAEGRDEIFAGRCRRSLVFERGLAFWCVGDQLRKGPPSTPSRSSRRPSAPRARPMPPRAHAPAPDPKYRNPKYSYRWSRSVPPPPRRQVAP